MTTREVLELVKEKYDVEYSQKQIGVILYNFNMHHSKPYTFDYRRTENTEEILKRLIESIPEYIGHLDQYIIGFLDEPSPKTKANTQILWSFKKPLMVKNTDYMKANAFIFYSINGRNLIDFHPYSPDLNMVEFVWKTIKEKYLLDLFNKKNI